MIENQELVTPIPLSSWSRVIKPVAGFFGVQVIVQILTMITGLLIVRTMSKSEYAFYTIANTMQGLIAILADSGTGSALSAIGGRVWQDKRRLGELIQTGLNFRRSLGLFVSFIVGPVLYWLLISQGASLIYALLITIVVLVTTSISLTHSILITVPRFHSRISQLQQADFAMAISRLTFVGAACFLFLNTFVAVIIAALTVAIQNIFYWKYAAQDADLTAPVNTEDRKAIWKLVQHQAPNTIYHCLQSQLTIFLIATFGSSNKVADVGALGRIAIILTVVGSVATNILIPRFARCQNAIQVASMYKKTIAVYCAFSLVFLVVGLIFPQPFLLILGEKYKNLDKELVYILFASSVGIISGIVYSLNASRGWLQRCWWAIPITFIMQVVLIYFLDLKTIEGAVLLTSLPALPALLPYIYRAHAELRVMSLSKAEN